MKKVLAIISIAVVIASCSSSKKGESKTAYALDTTKVVAGQPFYQCPMHLNVLSATPGNCPECGMALEKVIKQ